MPETDTQPLGARVRAAHLHRLCMRQAERLATARTVLARLAEAERTSTLTPEERQRYLDLLDGVLSGDIPQENP